MIRVKRLVWCLVLAVWLPATLHCRLETLPGFAFLDCAEAETNAPASPHHQNDCADDPCASLESGRFKPEETGAICLKPTQLWVVLLPLADTPPPAPRAWAAPAEGLCVAGSPRPWQFALRTALPPRAPSLAS